MTDEQRAALVDELAVILQRVKYVKLGESLRPIAEEIVDTVLADRGVPEQDEDAIYRERNQVVAALSKCFSSWIGTVDDSEPGWTKAVYVDLPSGQVSWHVPDHEILDMFGHLQESGAPWDGHTTEEKYERLAALAAVPTVRAAARDAEIREALVDSYGAVVEGAYERLVDQYDRNGKVDRQCAIAAVEGALDRLHGDGTGGQG